MPTHVTDLKCFQLQVGCEDQPKIDSILARLPAVNADNSTNDNIVTPSSALSNVVPAAASLQEQDQLHYHVESTTTELQPTHEDTTQTCGALSQVRKPSFCLNPFISNFGQNKLFQYKLLKCVVTTYDSESSKVE